jgi:hypothetical protein
MMKPLTICFAAGLTMSLGSASARDLHGTANSTIGSTGASTGMNGTLHSGANRALRGDTAAGERSINGSVKLEARLKRRDNRNKRYCSFDGQPDAE